jgi:hypothetical protein
MTMALSGPKSVFRNKLRGLVITILLTERGHRLLRRHGRRLGVSRSDLVELLLIRCAPKLTKADVARERV